MAQELPRQEAGPRPAKAWIAGRKALVAAVSLPVLLVLGGLGWWQLQVAKAASPSASSPTAAGSQRAGRRALHANDHAQPVSVGTVRQRDVRIMVDAIGSIAAANTAVVRTKADGELKALFFTEGQPVRAGQLLAQIDPRPYQIALTLAEGALARDQAQVRNAELDLQRYRDLAAKEAAPQQQLDTQQALVQQLKGTVLSDQASVDNARLQLGYTHVVAPISGLAGLKQADLGNIVHAADATGLLSIAQMQPAAVVFSVPDARLPRVRQQLQAGTPLPVEAWDVTRSTLLARGQVASTDNAIDPVTGTIRLKALFPNADNSLFANQAVNVRLQLDKLPNALAVPTAAVQRGARGTYVYAVRDGATVAQRNVQVLATDGDWAAVQAELAAGERVVIDGADRLRDGARVEVIEPAASAPKSAGLDAPRPS